VKWFSNHDIGRFGTKEVAALKYNEAAAQV
jgi:hypothetical protein